MLSLKFNFYLFLDCVNYLQKLEILMMPINFFKISSSHIAFLLKGTAADGQFIGPCKLLYHTSIGRFGVIIQKISIVRSTLSIQNE